MLLIITSHHLVVAQEALQIFLYSHAIGTRSLARPKDNSWQENLFHSTFLLLRKNNTYILVFVRNKWKLRYSITSGLLQDILKPRGFAFILFISPKVRVQCFHNLNVRGNSLRCLRLELYKVGQVCRNWNTSTQKIKLDNKAYCFKMHKEKPELLWLLKKKKKDKSLKSFIPEIAFAIHSLLFRYRTDH